MLQYNRAGVHCVTVDTSTDRALYTYRIQSYVCIPSRPAATKPSYGRPGLVSCSLPYFPRYLCAFSNFMAVNWGSKLFIFLLAWLLSRSWPENCVACISLPTIIDLCYSDIFSVGGGVEGRRRKCWKRKWKMSETGGGARWRGCGSRTTRRGSASRAVGKRQSCRRDRPRTWRKSTNLYGLIYFASLSCRTDYTYVRLFVIQLPSNVNRSSIIFKWIGVFLVQRARRTRHQTGGDTCQELHPSATGSRRLRRAEGERRPLWASTADGYRGICIWAIFVYYQTEQFNSTRGDISLTD